MQAKTDPGLVERILAWLSGILAPRPVPVPIRVRVERDPRDPSRRAPPRRF